MDKKVTGSLVQPTSSEMLIREEGIISISDAAWAEAKRREQIIAPIARRPTTPTHLAHEASEQLGLCERTIYTLIQRYRASQGLLSSLAPKMSSRGKGKSRLHPTIDMIIAEVIEQEYLNRQKKCATAVMREVRHRCIKAGLSAPSLSTVASRIRAIGSAAATKRRLGARSKAALRLKAAPGKTPDAQHPMAVVQIDHTSVDIILVDETFRKPLGRPS